MPSIPITTARIWPRATQRAAKPVRVAAFALGVLLLELVLAHGIAGPEISKSVYLFIGLFAVAFVFRFPMATALALFGLTDLVFYSTYFAYQVGPINVRPHELALAGLLTIAVLRPEKSTWGGTPGKALAVFLAMATLSAGAAIVGGATTLTEAFNVARPLFLLTFFYVVVRLFPLSSQRRVLLLGTAVLAAVTGVIALLVAFGAGFGNSLQAPGGGSIRSEGGFGSLDRVRLPGLSAGYAMFWYVAVQAISRRSWARLGWSALLLGIVIDIAVSFNRNMWLGLVIGLVLMGIVGGAIVRNRITATIAVITAGLVLFVVFGTSTSNNRIVEPIIQRGATIFNPGKTSEESSLQDRAKETEKAWATAQRHPLLGVGAGASFGVTLQQPILSGSLLIGFKKENQFFLHNQYLYLLLISGLPGLIAFVLFLGIPLSNALGRVPRDPAIAACGVGIALVMISAVVAIYFTVEDMTAILGLLAGVITADREGRSMAKQNSALVVR